MLEMSKIEGYDNYLVSKEGIIHSNVNNLDLKPYISSSGYTTVRLSQNGVMKNIYIHKLVAKIFLDNPNNYKYIRHKNGNKMDNRVENLEWYPTINRKR